MPTQTPASNSDARKRNAERERPAPGRRSEAEIKAEVWDEAVRECHGLGWLHDFALLDALTRSPYRAARIAGTTEAGGES